MRTLKSTPLALTVGSQTWVRKVLREIGVPTLVVNSRSFAGAAGPAVVSRLADRGTPGRGGGKPPPTPTSIASCAGSWSLRPRTGLDGNADKAAVLGRRAVVVGHPRVAEADCIPTGIGVFRTPTVTSSTRASVINLYDDNLVIISGRYGS